MNLHEVKAAVDLCKSFGELLKLVGPTPDHQRAVGRSFVGTLYGTKAHYSMGPIVKSLYFNDLFRVV
jgi:hypothetical protein